MEQIGLMELSCSLNGPDVSMIGGKKIVFNFSSGNVTLKDEGGIFKTGFSKSFPSAQFRIVNILKQISDYKISFHAGAYSGDFLLTDAASVKQFSRSFSASSPTGSAPVAYVYSFISGRENQLSAVYTGTILINNDNLILNNGSSKLISFNMSAIGNVISENSGVQIDIPFIQGSSFYSGIRIQNITKSDFETLLGFSFPSYADSSLAQSSVARVTGCFQNKNFNDYFCFSISDKDISIRSIHNESAYEKININISWEECLHAGIIANYLVVITNSGSLIFESDASTLDKVLQESYRLQKFHYRNEQMNYSGQGLLFIRDNGSVKSAMCGTLQGNMLLLNGPSEKLEISMDNSAIDHVRRFSIIDYQIRIVSQNIRIDLICTEAVKFLLESYMIKNNRQDLYLSTDDFTHPDEHKSLHKIQKLIIAEKAILDNHELIKERLSIPDLSGKTIMVTERQFSGVHKIVKQAAQLLNIPIPPTYVFDTYFYSVDSEGYKSPRLEISSRTIEDFSEAELKFLIGSKMAHIACGHLKYEVLIEGLLEALPKIDSIPIIGNFINALPATQAMEMYYKINFFDWYRNSILSADRFGLLFSGSLESSVTALLKLILNNQKLVDSIYLQDYLAQRENINTLLGIVAFYTKSDEAIPYGQERILNLFGFSHQNSYVVIKSKIENIMCKQNLN